jgi:hypothetical protein
MVMKTQADSFQLSAEVDRAAAEEARRDLADALGTSDRELVEGFRRLGLDGDTAEAFSLLPLVYVAWAEGRVSGPERRRVLDAARSRGLVEGTPAHDRVLDWLEERPEERTFEVALRLIEHTLETTAAGHGGARATRLLGECIQVAKASGGVRGFVGEGDDVCAEEMAALRRVAGYLIN